jgi:hypothetical protein
MEDYAHIAQVLCTAHESLPANALLAGVPMLMALEAAIASTTDESDGASIRVIAIKQVIAHVWSTIGKVWGVDEITGLAQMVSITAIGLVSLAYEFFYRRSPQFQIPKDFLS